MLAPGLLGCERSGQRALESGGERWRKAAAANPLAGGESASKTVSEIFLPCFDSATQKPNRSEPAEGHLLAAASLTEPAPAPQQQTAQRQAASSGSESSSPASANLISADQLAGLPLNGRSYSQLATLQTGVSDPSVGGGSRGIFGGNLSIVGGRSSSNSYLLDGTNIMDFDNRLPLSAAGIQLGSDAVFQVQVFSPNYGAEYGRNSGGVLNSLTRSGTAEFHGSVFEFFRNSNLDARNFFDDGPEPPPFKRNQFGFTLTGPLRKEKTYFLGSYEAMRDRFNETNVGFFPDEPARRGVITRTNGEIDHVVSINHRVQPYLALFPLTSSSVGGGIGEAAAPVFLPTDEDFFTVRLDHQISDRDSVFARYTFDTASSWSSNDDLVFRNRTQSRQQYLTLVGTRIFNLRVLTSFRFGYTRPLIDLKPLPIKEVPPSMYFSPGAPQFGRLEVPGLTGFGPNPRYPRAGNTNTFQFANDTVYREGPHTLKWGFELHRYRSNVHSSQNQSGVWSFNSLDSFLQGGPGGTTLRIALPGSDSRMAYRQTLVGLYVQDAYSLTPRLELNLGLRYEFTSMIHDHNGKDVFFPDWVRDTEVRRGPFFQTNPSLRNLAPRVGMNWSPRNRSLPAVSAGFGIYYDEILVNMVHNTKSSWPFYKSVVRTNFDSSATFPDAVAAAGDTPFEVLAFDYRHVKTPMVLRYNLALQQELVGGWRVRASYVGARGNRLVRSYEANLYPIPIKQPDGSLFFPPNSGPINPAFAAIELYTTDGQSFYNSFQLSANRSLRNGVFFQGSYTYAKSVDDSSSQTSDELFQFPLMRTLDRALSDFDIRHRLAINYFYTVPFGSGQRGGTTGFLSKVFGGWRLGGIVSLRSGTPFSPRISVRNPGYLFAASRPNLIAGQSKNPTGGTTAGCFGVVEPARELGGHDLYFDPCVYAVPLPGTMGNAGRNTIIAPNIYSMDFSLQREFVIDGKRRLSFRAELFNLPNHTNFSGASSRIFTGASGQSRLSSSAGKIRSTATTARQIQFALRLSF
ncbi:MAG: TonB-dependent receptor [Acidobacteria bacterium]|nr:TonB-dependent receptor [Acidobacteriota bacterium]